MKKEGNLEGSYNNLGQCILKTASHEGKIEHNHKYKDL